ncbi:MAG: tetratricopeptide repeat protein [Cyanobacteria bacterium J06621_15]
MQGSKLNRRLKLFSLFFLSQCSFLVFFDLLFFTKLVAATPVVKVEEIAQQPSSTQDTIRAAANKAFEEGLKLYEQGTIESLRQAIKKWEETLSLFHRVNDKGGEAIALLGIGRIYSDLGEKQKALQFYNQALPLFRAVGDRQGEAFMLNNIGRVYDALGEKQKALEFYNQALPLFRAVGDRKGEAITLNNIGKVYDNLEEKQKALEFYSQALPLFRGVGYQRGEAVTLNNIGSVYSDLGEKQKALEFYNQALPLRRAVGDRSGEAITLHNIGRIHSDLAQQQKALEFYNQALPVHRAAGDRSGEATTLSSIGTIYLALAQQQKALEFYNQALRLHRAVGDRSGEAVTLNNIGAVYLALGQKQKALQFFNQALPLRRAVGDRNGEATTLGNIGLIYRDTNQPKEAIKYWEQSATITLELRNYIARENRKTFFESERIRASALIDLLINQNQPQRAFEWANLAAVADLADYSRLIEAKVANPKAQQAIDEWNQKNIQLESLRKNLQEKFSEELSQRVNQLQEELNQQAEEIRNSFLEVADLFETKPTDIAKLRASIPAGTTVIQPILLTNISDVPDTIALFVFSTDKLTVKKIPINPTKFNALLTQTNASLINRFDEKYLDNLEQLYNLIIRPIETEIQTTKPKQLSFIASGKLRYIPFEALYDSKADQYLIEKLPISYLTRISPNSLAAKTVKTQSSKRVLAIGNPEPNGKLALQGAETEVNKIREIFPGSQAFINNQARLDTFKIQSPRFSFLHLATHGCFKKGGCLDLGLEENTLLFADKKFNIRDAALLGLQNTDLITLSACQTALQTESNGEEISGLAYLFERAGAKATVASLWSADDKTTQKIMVEFYQNIKTGMSKDEALRQAKLSQIDSHPFFWSAFVLIGDAR